MDYQCQIREQSEQPVLSIRRRTSVQDLPQLLGETYGRIAGCLAEMGEQPVGAPFAAYYNMDMQDLDVEIGFPTARPLAGKDDIQPGVIPGGKLAYALHTGPYSEIAPAYDALTLFVKEQGYQPSGVAYEFYMNDPQETQQAELHTQIVFPLK